jgi:3',5'-cyclic AMP phosphodiesterase CpdA
MLLLGHLSDLHLKGEPNRRARIVSALAYAKTFKPDHLVLTGDLTSSGTMGQMAELSNVLAETGWTNVTVIPGNHDAGHAFDQALSAGGHLERFERFSRGVVDLGEVRIVPLDTRFRKRAVAFSALGLIGKTQLAGLESVMASGHKTTIIAQHHGPQYHPLGFFDGLVDRGSMLSFLKRHPSVHLLAGHDHRVLDIGSIHVAASAAHHLDPLRLYRVGAGGFEVAYKSQSPGSYLTFGRPR